MRNQERNRKQNEVKPSIERTWIMRGGHYGSLDLRYAPSDEEFAKMRRYISQVDGTQEARRAEYEQKLRWLTQLIEYDPETVRKALGCSGDCCGG